MATYEWKGLAERQREHLERVLGNKNANWRPCMHDQCPQCVGTGIKHDGSACIHGISCPCPKCSPQCSVLNIPILTCDALPKDVALVMDQNGFHEVRL